MVKQEPGTMSATPFNWVPKDRKYAVEREKCKVNIQEAHSHPLKGITVTVTESKARNTGGTSRSSSLSSLDHLATGLEGSDPLSMFAAENTDPLSKMAAESSKFGAGDKMQHEEEDVGFISWSSHKEAILTKYTTSEKLSITTSFLSLGEKAQTTVTVSDKVKNRLEQLDDFEEGSVQEMLNLSQQEYVKRIDELNSALILAWDQDQRVRALKIAIQCAKLLADVSVIQFYPSKFVLITDILDTFGRLVFDRIKNKATYLPKGSSKPVQLPDDFTPEQVPESAKETCRNWFFKIASIRELIPRFYVEAAILKCYGYLTTGEYNQALKRLSLMTRGIGDPLVALYSRSYLCRVGMVVAPSVREHLMCCFDDFLSTYKQIQCDHVQNVLAGQKVELPQYLTLYSPGLNWILLCIAQRATDKILDEVLHKSQNQCNSGLLLNSILSAFKPEYVACRATLFTTMIKECEDAGFPKYLLYKSLGNCLVTVSPPDDDKLQLLNDVWKVIVKLKNSSDYIDCVETWIEYIAKNFSNREVNTVLSDIIKHMTPDRAYEAHYRQLRNIISRIVTHMHDFSQLFSLEKFLPFLDMFQKESMKVEVCKTIMEAYSKYQTEKTNDPVITNALMSICKTMHDSVNALSLDDDIRYIGQLIINFIASVSFGRDFEQHLSFYVDTRASFSNIDIVLVFLVQCVNSLAMETRQIVRGQHTKKTSSFVRACCAYTFITIPSLNGIFSRLNLYLISGQVALANHCLSQADAFFKASVSLLPEVTSTMEIDNKLRATDPFLFEYINNLSSALLVIPDNPEKGTLYLVRGLLNAVGSWSWDMHSDTKALLYMNFIVLLSAMCQDTYPYSIYGVDSNDKLYGHDPKFTNECISLCNTLKDEILAALQMLDRPDMYKRQAVLAHEMFNRVIAHGDLQAPQISELAVKLWSLAQKHGQLDTKLSVRTLTHLRKCSAQDKAIKSLLPMLPIQSRT